MIFRRSKNALALIAILVAATACSRAEEVTMRYGIDVDNGDDNSGLEGGAPITGGWLTYENGRVRCDYKDLDHSIPSKLERNYLVSCVAMANQNGDDTLAIGVQKGLQLNWTAPLVTAGMSMISNCAYASNNLSMKCEVKMTSSSSKVQFGLSLKSTAQDSNSIPVVKSRQETSVVVFPFYVGLAAGFVPSMPLYQPQTESLSLASGFKSGFVFRKHEANRMSLEANEICAAGEYTYVTDGYQIYRIEGDGRSELYAGSINGDPQDFSHRLRIKLNMKGNPGLFCTTNGLYVADQFSNRILFVSHEGPIKHIAGTGEKGYTGDGGPAVAAKLGEPFGLYLHADGTLYFTDTANKVVRKIDKDGIISTFAGNGVRGTAGDNVPAREASFVYPERIIYDSKNDRFFVNDFYGMIVRVIKDGKMSTYAGGGSSALGYGFSGDGGLAINAQLYNPTGMALLDDGSLLIADYSNNRIRRVDPNGKIYTFAGNGTEATTDEMVDSGLALQIAVSSPNALYLKDKNTVLFSEYNGMYGVGSEYRIRSISLPNGRSDVEGTISTFLGASKAELGNKYYSRFANALDFSLPLVTSIAHDPTGKIFFSGLNQIRRINGDGKLELIAGEALSVTETPSNGTLAKNFRFKAIKDIAFDKKGRLYVADFRVVRGGVNWGGNIFRINLDANGRISPESPVEMIFDDADLYKSHRGLVEIYSISVNDDGDLAIGNYFGQVYIAYANSNGDLPINPPLDLSLEFSKVGDYNYQTIADLDFSASGDLLIAIDNPYSDSKLVRIPKTGSGPLKYNFANKKVMETPDKKINTIHALSDGSILGNVLQDMSNGVLRIKEDPSPTATDADVSSLLKPGTSVDCGAGQIRNSAARENLQDEFLSSFSTICSGKIVKISATDNCKKDGGGSLNIAIVHEFAFQKKNIIQVIRPCEGL